MLLIALGHGSHGDVIPAPRLDDRLRGANRVIHLDAGNGPVWPLVPLRALQAQDEGAMRIHRMRQIQGYLGDKEMTHKLVTEVAPRYLDRNGGYLRILKLGPRQGDNAQMSRSALVTLPNVWPMPRHPLQCGRRSATQ